MALNFSHRPIFSAHLSEDNLVSPMRMANGYLVEGMHEMNGEGFGSPWRLNGDAENSFDHGRDRCDRGGSQDSVSRDIIDLLPSDPFGMDISTTFTAITGWLEDLEEDYGGYGSHDDGTNDQEYNVFAELNFFWNNAMRLRSFNQNIGEVFGDKSTATVCAMFSVEEVGDVTNLGGFRPSCDAGDVQSFGDRFAGAGGHPYDECLTIHSKGCHDGVGGTPHAALMFALGYLGLRDLLSAERVCRSFRSAIKNDPLLWRSIHIDQPLNEKITDDVLLQLTDRAQGNLQCLSLVECPRFTDDALKRVLESNPKLTKLCVPGCSRLSIEGIMASLRAFKSTGAPGIKHLRVGGLYGVTHTHFEELKILLGMDNKMEPNGRKPHFYHRGNFYLSCDDDRAIDIELCPRCQNLRLVYDCPAEGCQVKEHAPQSCRACTLCIPRCVQCGRCINDSEYEETFCLELLCSDCGKQLVKGQERHDRKFGFWSRG